MLLLRLVEEDEMQEETDKLQLLSEVDAELDGRLPLATMRPKPHQRWHHRHTHVNTMIALTYSKVTVVWNNMMYHHHSTKVRFLLTQRCRDQLHFTITGSGSWLARANGASIANCGHTIARVNVQMDPQLQLASTPPLQSTTPGLHPVNTHQMAPPVQRSRRPITTSQPQKYKRLSWLTCSRRFTYISGHPSAADRVQDSESLPAEDRRSTTVPCYQPVVNSALQPLFNDVWDTSVPLSQPPLKLRRYSCIEICVLLLLLLLLTATLSCRMGLCSSADTHTYNPINVYQAWRAGILS